MPRQQVSEQQKQQFAQQLGFDASKIDWAKVLQVIEAIIGIFGGGNSQQKLKAAGCPDPEVPECDVCMQAGHLALQSALISFQHCQDCCQQAQTAPPQNPQQPQQPQRPSQPQQPQRPAPGR